MVFHPCQWNPLSQSFGLASLDPFKSPLQYWREQRRKYPILPHSFSHFLRSHEFHILFCLFARAQLIHPLFSHESEFEYKFQVTSIRNCVWWLLDYCNGQGSHCWSYDTRICIAEFALEGVLSCVCVQLSSLNIDSSIGSSIQQPQCWVHFHSTQQHQHVSNSIPPRPVDGGWSTGCAMIFIFVPVQEFEILRPHSVCMNKFVLWNKIELSGQLLKTGSALASACGCARNN